MIDKKWPHFKKAFKNFSVDDVAKFSEQNLQHLMRDAGIVRNRAKIRATMNNAKQFENIQKEYGSFQHYLESLDKSDNYPLVIKELGKKFSREVPLQRVSPSIASEKTCGVQWNSLKAC
jgi:DNA-3-methyladenine glycosylase I